VKALPARFKRDSRPVHTE